MAVNVPVNALGHTSSFDRRWLIGLAGLRFGLTAGVALLAPWLYREHAGMLVLLRPTKEVFLFAGFQVREGDLALPVAVAAALPLLLAGVWLFFALGRAFADELADADLPGVAGRVLPKERIDQLRGVLDERGTRVVFLGRMAAFPSSLMAAAAGSSDLPWRRFLLADAAGALVSLAVTLALGYALGEAYDEGGPWVTAGGVVVLVGLAVMVGRGALVEPLVFVGRHGEEQGAGSLGDLEPLRAVVGLAVGREPERPVEGPDRHGRRRPLLVDRAGVEPAREHVDHEPRAREPAAPLTRRMSSRPSSSRSRHHGPNPAGWYVPLPIHPSPRASRARRCPPGAAPSPGARGSRATRSAGHFPMRFSSRSTARRPPACSPRS